MSQLFPIVRHVEPESEVGGIATQLQQFIIAVGTKILSFFRADLGDNPIPLGNMSWTEMMAETDGFSPGDKIILVMGPPGAGKSNFIAKASGQGEDAVNHDLIPSRSSITRIVKANSEICGHNVVFVDAPSFDDGVRIDTEILGLIAEDLFKIYKERIKLAGIIYVHSISKNRINGAQMNHLRVLQDICGADMSSVTIVTSMWDEVVKDVAQKREAGLKNDIWAKYMGKGCTTKRFYNTADSALSIVSGMVNNVGIALRLPKMADQSEFCPEDKIIVVMGPPGSGKSNFVAKASKTGEGAINHDLNSTRSSDVRVVRANCPINGQRVVFVDAPPFDVVQIDIEILGLVADYLAKIYKGHIKVAGIVYMHPICQNRVDEAQMNSLRVFKNICGGETMSSVAIVMSMWDEVVEEVAQKREAALKSNYWQEYMNHGCATERFHNTHDSALSIISAMVNGPGIMIPLGREPLPKSARTK